jgi:hypothetical protein
LTQGPASAPPSTPASAISWQTPAKQTKPSSHCSMRVHGCPTCFGVMFWPHPHSSKIDNSHSVRHAIVATIAHAVPGDHAPHRKRC